MKWIIAIVVLLFLCCCILIGTAAFVGGISYFTIDSAESFYEEESLPTVKPSITPRVNDAEISPGAFETENTLRLSIVPENDPQELAFRLEGKANIPKTLEAPAIPLQVGATKNFWITNTDTNESSSIPATLQYITDHVYFWVDDSVELSAQDRSHMERLVETFENEIYPTNRKFFGSEWTPGIDNDPHLYILYAHGLGYSIAGYFSSTDSVHPLAHEYSNAHEMFMLSADNAGLHEAFTYGVLAHEFQHMIHWYRDRNEETWLNEGFAELAAFLNDYYLGGFDYYYIMDPDIQLTDWPNDQYTTTPHYGAAFLFVNYFLNRFGNEATQALVSHDKNGMDSVDLVLSDLNIIDDLTGELITADDVFADWVIASYLKDRRVADGRYTYENYGDAPQADPTEYISECPTNLNEFTVSQYGVDYIQIDCEGDFSLYFEGDPEVQVLPADAYSGDYAFWSNKGDESDMTLTRQFDFSGISGPITLNYWMWYDIEEDYDYLYLLSSEDGESWTILTTPSGTPEDPSGNSFGWGYNGATDGWKQERIDLSQFAGKKVYLRFEYITDAAVNGEGFFLDDLSIPELDYQTDFEKDDGGWEASGFVRIQNRLPQTFRISIISEGRNTSVQKFSVEAGQSLELPISIGSRVDDVTLVVSGTTRHTRIPAVYRFSLKE